MKKNMISQNFAKILQILTICIIFTFEIYGQNLVFQDSNFESKLRNSLNLSSTFNITSQYASTITQLNLSNGSITSINDLNKFPNLEICDLSSNNITNIDFLSQLNNLRYINLNLNKITILSTLTQRVKPINISIFYNYISNFAIPENYLYFFGGTKNQFPVSSLNTPNFPIHVYEIEKVNNSTKTIKLHYQIGGNGSNSAAIINLDDPEGGLDAGIFPVLIDGKTHIINYTYSGNRLNRITTINYNGQGLVYSSNKPISFENVVPTLNSNLQNLTFQSNSTQAISFSLLTGTSFTGNARIVGANASNFTLNSTNVSLIAGSSTQALNITFNSATSGNKTATLEIYNASGVALSIPLAGSISVNNACLSASISSINLLTGNTNIPTSYFFTLNNTSASNAVTINSVQFTGPDAQYFSYDSRLFSVPNTINPSLNTGFSISVSNALPQNRTYNTNLVLSTNNALCPTVTIPVSAVFANSSLIWLSPTNDFTHVLDYNPGAGFDLLWQGNIPGNDPFNISVDIEYSIENGPWTLIPNTINCQIAHNNNSSQNIKNITFAQLSSLNVLGKTAQFRIRPCNLLNPWQYSGKVFFINTGTKTIELISPNGNEVFTAGEKRMIRWNDYIGYKNISLYLSTNNKASYQLIADKIPSDNGFYEWTVPVGINSENCFIKVVANNVFDESNYPFYIQTPSTNPFIITSVNTNPENCLSTPKGSITVNMQNFALPGEAIFLKNDGTLLGSYNIITGNSTLTFGYYQDIPTGNYKVIIRDVNNKRQVAEAFVPLRGNYGAILYTKDDICSGSKGQIQVNLTNGFPFPGNYTFFKNDVQVYTGSNPTLDNISGGLYKVNIVGVDGCLTQEITSITSSPGTYFPITPTVTNTSCSGSTGAISLNVGTAQSPTYLWSNGATTQNLTALAAGQYSVNVNDATGCVQTQKYEVFEEGGLVENKIVGNVRTQGDYGCFQLNQGKLYFGNYNQTGTPTNSLGILDIQSNAYDFITIPSLFYTTSTSGLVPTTLDVTSSDIYTAVRDWNGSGTDIHYLKISKSTKQITGRKIISGNSYLYKMQYINGSLYTLRADNSMDIVNFSNNTSSKFNFLENVVTFVTNTTNTKMYIVGSTNKLYEFDINTNTITRTGTLTIGYGWMIQMIGTTLYIAGYNAGDANTYVESFDINSFLSTGKTAIRLGRNFGWGRSFVKDNRYFYVPAYNPKMIDIFDTQTKTVTAILLTTYTKDIDYSITDDKILVNGGEDGIARIDNNKFDYTTPKIDASCGLNNGSITLTIPNDGKTYTYLWSNGATTKDVSGLLAGSYTVTVTQTGGCALKKTVVIAQLSTGITATLSPNSGTLCPSQTITLQSTAGASYVWYKDNVVISGATSQTYSVSLAGVYKVVVTNSSGCSGTSNNSTVTAITSPTANFTNVASGNVVTFTNTSTNGNQYLWNFGDATTDTQFSPIKTYSGGGGTFTVTLRVTNSCGIYSDVSKSVTVSCTNMYTLKTGNWNDITVWSCGRVPTSTDIITVKANHFVTIPASYTANAKNVIFEAVGGRFIYTANSSKLCLSCPVTIPINGLIAYYPLNGNANDASGNSLNGSIVGSITSITDRKGVANSAYQFSGIVLNYISIPDNALLCSNIITLNAWVNFAPSEGGYIINKGRDIQNGSYRLTSGSAGGQVLYGGINDASYASVPTNQWVMVTGIINGNSAKYYVNGVMVSQATLSSSYVCSSAGNPLTIGNHYYNGVPNVWAYPYKGKIDDVRIYNRALSDAEVLQIYNGEKP